MPHPDPTAAAAWSRVLARLDGADAPTSTSAPDTPTTAAPDAPTADGVPAWFAALAAVPTTTAASPAPSRGTPTSVAPVPTSAEPIEEGFVAWLDRRRAERAARGG